MSDTYDDDFDLLDSPTPRASGPAQAGDEVTALVSGITISLGGFMLGGSGVVLTRGQVFVLTSAMIEASRDNTGAVTWPSIVHDERAQVEKWGQARFRLGRHDLERWADAKDPFWEVDHSQARSNALAIVDPSERAAALDQVRERFGRKPPSDSHTTYRDSRRERVEADAAAAREGVRGVRHA